MSALRNAKAVADSGNDRLFQLGPSALRKEQQLNTVIKDGAVFDLDKPAMEKLINDKVKFLTLSLPDGALNKKV